MSDRITTQRRAALADAGREVQALRADWREAVQHHELRVSAQFQELGRRLRIRVKGRQPKGLPSAKEASQIRTLLAGVRVKASKGRAKDLRRIEHALAQALEKLPAE